MTARTIGAVAMAVLAVITACGVQSSSIDPNATVSISGKALSVDGYPLANTKVVLVKELDLGESVGGLFVTAVTLGLACLADHPPALCAKNAHVATTDGNGAYSFSVKASDTTGSFEVASTMEVMVHGAANDMEVSGPTAMAEFSVQTTSLALPDLRLWKPNRSFGANGQAAWTALPASYGTSPAYSVELYDLHGNPWWVTGPMQPGDRFDSRILEDLNGAVDVAARAHGTAPGTTVDFTYASAALHMHGAAGPPPSRAAHCAAVTSGGVGAFDTSCALTSGNLGQHLPASFGSATGVIVDLGHEGAVSLVVVKGCTAQCAVAVSSDLTGWSQSGTLSGAYATAPVTLNRSARYVRISGADIAGLRQVSIW